MSQQGAQRLSELKEALTRDLMGLAGAQASAEALSDSVDECLRCLRSRLVGLPDERALAALISAVESLELSLGEMWRLATRGPDELSAWARAARLWQSRLMALDPWSPLTERALTSLTEELLTTLGLSPVGLALWAESLPSCSPELWVERGVDEAVERLIAASDERPEATHGLSLDGVGSSAALAWAGRALSERGFEAAPALPASAPWALEALEAWAARAEELRRAGRERALLIDELSCAARPLIWRLAALLSSAERPALLLWTGGAEGLSRAFESALRAARLTLPPWTEGDWATWSALAGGERPVNARADNMSGADQLRLAERAWLSADRGLHSMLSLPREEPLEPIELIAAALGPLSMSRGLVEGLGEPQESIEGQLSFAGFTQLGPSKPWGLIWAHSRGEQWAEALAELSAQLMSAASVETGLRAQLSQLLAALSAESLRGQRWTINASLKRLGRWLSDSSGLRPSAALDLAELRGGLKLLKPLLEQEAPHPLSLGLLCGLALDWAAQGPESAPAQEALEALQLGAAAAERLGDPLRGGRLLYALGRRALYEGLASPARSALEASSQLLLALRRPPEALRALSAWAEAEVLAGELKRALKLYERAEGLMRQQGYSEGLWPLRFKRGQLTRQMGYPREALELWRALSEGQGALGATLSMERALALLALGDAELDQVEVELDSLEESPLKRCLKMRASALRGAPAELEAGVQLIVELNQARDLGAWLCACELWSLSILEGGEAMGALEAASRMLEEALKGASVTRDRLALTTLYGLLSACYERRGLKGESAAACALSMIWQEQLRAELGSLSALKLRAGSPLSGMSAEERGALMTQVRAEVEAQLKRWAEPIHQLGSSEHSREA